MSDKEKAARLHHMRTYGLAKGDPLALPLTMASMFNLPGDPEPGVAGYGRMDNPTWEALEDALGLIEDAPVRVFPSGMAAIAAVLFVVLKAGDRVLIPSDGYYTTRLLADGYLAKLGVEVVTRPTVSIAEGGFEGFALVFLETPSNPGLDVIDLAETCRAVRAAGGVSVVDNTTMTPFGQRPLDLGADVVVASDTKAPGGHSDVLIGHVASRDADLIDGVSQWRKLSGAIPGPFEAWLLYRSLATLELRFERMCNSAEAIAARLAGHPAVDAVRYPGLGEDPAHDVASRQMTRFGFLIGVTLADREAAERLINGCEMLASTTSFGGTHSTAERRARWGDEVAPGFVRLSVGVEPLEPLWAALNRALADLS
ncbi:cystathionine gamma-lyase [Maritimibacter sp. UBA3975]|uniref:cystathionine gamma-lyase n=1 Tax=Maritimibacter sp. UBA3975 TaxID=1946833 RepID=UPI000C0A2798|nr:cystathionine gamma-lyase [Maritimibacter sp. UBA3975]MAM62552.1 cystathionine gamma-lyase [Maritimibacter sp.]|tara:strand:+ start:7999 stop:9108 length:1110 start_codon:yes stop_codon:yes gene_type:complete